MADPPRPPMTSLDAAWDDDPTVATPDADAALTDPDGDVGPLPGAEPETRAVSGEELDRILEDPRAVHAGGTDTVQLGGDEIAKLLAKGRAADPPPFASALDVPVASTGLPDAEEVADAFDRLEAGLESPSPSPSPAHSPLAPPPAPIGRPPAPIARPLGPPAVTSTSAGRAETFPSNPFMALPPVASPVPPPSAFDSSIPPPIVSPVPAAAPIPPPAPSHTGPDVHPAAPSHPGAASAWTAPVAGPAPPPAAPSQPSTKQTSPLAGISPRVLAAVVGAAATLAVATVLIGRLVSGGGERAPASSADTSPRLGSSVHTPVPLPATTVETTAGSADAAALEALERFRQGLVRCVRESIHVLPGTSPAVPATIAKLSGSGYASHPSEWKKPVFACARFSVTGAQRFQFQWQKGRTSSEGKAVAWVDSDGDGKADRAFGFTATLAKRGVVEVGAIEPLDPMPAIAAPR